MKNFGFLALALTAALGADAWAGSAPFSSGGKNKEGYDQQGGENRRQRYAKILLARALSEEDEAICARKVPAGDAEQKDICHVTRNYLADIVNKSDQLKPVQAEPRYVVTREEWDAMKSKM